MNKAIEKILISYLMNNAGIEDLEFLSNWLKDDANKKIFKDYIRIKHAIDLNVSEFNTERAKKKFLQKIREEKQKNRRLKIYRAFKYAAAVILICGVASTFFLEESIFNPQKEKNRPVIVSNSNYVEPGSNKATLTLGDSTVMVLDGDETFNLHLQNANVNEEGIYYEREKEKTKEIVYNYLTIPRGGQFFIKLSDGTQIWLNSETQLKYPVNFPEGETRKVELVYGEAYFDVSPSSEHKGAKFMVSSQSQMVEVLGTTFNIKAYKDETNIYTTLVEGRVMVDNGISKQFITPGQQYWLNTSTNDFKLTEVDVKNIISWKEGLFSFRGMKLDEIMKVISRWYDVDVIFQTEALKEITFVGVLGKNQNLEEIMDEIKVLSVLEDYEIKDKRLILK